ncbi:FAD-dependent oxidoreductase, partial [Sphaerisporangium sp. NPDC049002]|uniref:FAD-dependent oxidoreductase n=1 Tax=Sphaerisporangium sp. NPDC049002 TaxID=3155392 RepID=UPI00340AEC64
MRLVVVGNGMAGARLASEVRALDRSIQITVFGAETRGPYNRVLLSNVLAGTASPEQVADRVGRHRAVGERDQGHRRVAQRDLQAVRP